MKKLGDLDDLPVRGAHLLAHPREPVRPDFQLRHPDRILIGHAQRQLARGFGQQSPAAVAMQAFRLRDRCEPVEITARVVDVLVVDQSVHARPHQIARIDGHAGDLGGEPRSVGGRRRRRGGRRHGVGARRLEPGRKCGEVLAHADAAPAHGGFERGTPERQYLGARNGTQKDRADVAAGRIGERRHVGADETPGRDRAGVDEPRGVDPAVLGRDLLRHRIDPMGRGDQGGAVRRHQAALDRASGLHQLRRHHEIDVARDRHQREHRIATGRLGVFFGEQLEIVDRGAGSLRDARNRCELRDMRAVLGRIDQPIRQDAAAFPAHGQNGDRDRPRRNAHGSASGECRARDPALQEADDQGAPPRLEAVPTGRVGDQGGAVE